MNNRKRHARCHTPDKIPYRYEGEARRAAADAAAGYGYAIDYYECRTCGFWHLTKAKR